MGSVERIKLLVLAFCLTLHVAVAAGPKAEKLTSQNPCASKASCSECIQTKTCAWCLQPQVDFGDSPRCFQPSYSDSTNVCPEEFSYNPDSQLTQVTNKELSRSKRMDFFAAGGAAGAGHEGESAAAFHQQSRSSSSGSYSSSSYDSASGHSSSSMSWRSEEEIVQIKPQRVNLKLRVNQEYRLQMTYSQAEDYPVDLYYLMDLSKSMEDDKMSLSLLGDSLATKMRQITSNFRLGFGSFVDKVLMPYVSTVPKKLVSPCTNCEAPYGFKHHLVLSTNSTLFSEEVRRASVSGNLDAPEGGFDAIMQAVACRDRIGWREQARRLLVFSTDAGFHYAGDGKLGGVIKPNDGQCHLDHSNRYTHAETQDYPSISQINMKVKQSSINLIFAVTEDQLDVYKRLSQHIEGSSAAQLANDSSNVIDLIQKQYEEISSSVEMKDNAASFIKIVYKSKCLDENAEPVVTNKCNGLRVGNKVEFFVEITVQQCPKDPKDWKQSFQIYPVGLNESMTVDLELLCNCECESTDHHTFQRLSPECNYQGSLKCGICECNDSFFGRQCECSTLDVNGEADRDLACRPDNTTTTDCSGRGNCLCGVCDCDKRADATEVISGKFCQCDNFSCDRHNGLLCSGPDHGTCQCGQCLCHGKWTGSSCDCLASNETCTNPTTGEICSGKGECVCGQCVCQSTTEGRYSGQFCEKCPTCSGRCHEFKDCVQCQMYKTGPMGKDEEMCAKNCTLFVPIEEEKVEAREELDEVLCTFYDEEDCRFHFVYTDKDEIKVRAQKERECPPKVFILGIILGVIAAIVLIGLAILLLWKLLTTISDRREFAKFEKERMMAKWDTGENPIYKQATSTFKNPTYAGK